RRVLRALEFLLGFCYWIALAFALDIFLLDYLDPCLGVLASSLSFSRSLSSRLLFQVLATSLSSDLSLVSSLCVRLSVKSWCQDLFIQSQF
ncbi:hypothetical protein BgiMline_000754, partial [Biomphalaria glabrata]